MTSTERCHNCGSTDIEEDNARGDRGNISKYYIIIDNIIKSSF